MQQKLSWLDRIRIERVVWTLDQRLYDLPRASRVATRREVRQNLIAAAGDVGTRTALRQLGDTSSLASEYLGAHFGSGPRHSWLAAGLFLVTYPFLMFAFLSEATNGFADGVVAAKAHATGTYTWSGIELLQTKVTYTFTNGHWTSVGGAMSAFSWTVLVVGTVAAGRLWRALPVSRSASGGPLADETTTKAR
jgi:hypothetical protein